MTLGSHNTRPFYLSLQIEIPVFLILCAADFQSTLIPVEQQYNGSSYPSTCCFEPSLSTISSFDGNLHPLCLVAPSPARLVVKKTGQSFRLVVNANCRQWPPNCDSFPSVPHKIISVNQRLRHVSGLAEFLCQLRSEVCASIEVVSAIYLFCWSFLWYLKQNARSLHIFLQRQMQMSIALHELFVDSQSRRDGYALTPNQPQTVHEVCSPESVTKGLVRHPGCLAPSEGSMN